MKRLLTFIISFGLLVAGTASASLWSYYSEKGENLPSLEKRAEIYGNYYADEYRGTALQNTVLEQLLREKGEVLGGTRQTSPIAGATYYLAGSGLTSSATSITLQTLTLPQNGYKITDADVSDTFYITLEPGNTKRQEIASCTTITQNAGGTATLSGCVRGLSPIYPYTSSSTLQFAHAGGTQVIFSDAPQLFEEYTSKTSTSTIAVIWKFGVFPESDVGTTPTTSQQFVTKEYADNLVNQGAATSSESIAGIIEQATAIETASTTQFDVNNPHAINSEQATSTPAYSCNGTATVGALCIPVAENDGKLNQSWIDKAEHFAFTSIFATNASTTAVTSTNAEFTTVSTTNLTLYNQDAKTLVNGSDASSLHTHTNYNTFVSSTNQSLTIAGTTNETTVASVSIPANTLGTDECIVIDMYISNIKTNIDAGGNATLTIRLKYGSSTLATLSADGATGGYPATLKGYLCGNGTTSKQFGELIGVAYASSSWNFSGTPSVWTERNTSTATEDSTGALNFQITSQMSSGAAGPTVTYNNTYIYQLTK